MFIVTAHLIIGTIEQPGIRELFLIEVTSDQEPVTYDICSVVKSFVLRL